MQTGIQQATRLKENLFVIMKNKWHKKVEEKLTKVIDVKSNDKEKRGHQVLLKRG